MLRLRVMRTMGAFEDTSSGSVRPSRAHWTAQAQPKFGKNGPDTATEMFYCIHFFHIPHLLEYEGH